MRYLLRLNIIVLLILLSGLVFTSKTQAASLSNASDQLSTSRPSAAAPLTAGFASGVGQVTVIDLAGSAYNSALWLASDSATFLRNNGTPSESINVASMSAANTPSANQRTLFFTANTAAQHFSGETVITPITATHTIKFTTVTAIPGSGKIVITFPGAGSNIASPSATGFSFNNLASGQIQANNATCSSYTIGANSITCNLNASGVAANTTVTLLVGCTTQSSGVCTVFNPRLINPVKTTQAVGSADQWKIGIKTQDASSVDLDSATVVAGIIESVQVQGTVEPYMTMTIAGVTNGASACGDTTNPGAGLDSTATFVNLGSLSSGQVNRSAQTIQIDTNGSFGYTLTATSAGRFVNPSTGFYLADANGGNGLTANNATNGTTPSPAAITAGVSDFGIHPCATSGSPAPTIPTGWGSGGGGSNNYANPWNNQTNGYYALLSSTSAPSAASITTIEYAAAVSATTPAGIYTTVFTYVATARF